MPYTLDQFVLDERAKIRAFEEFWNEQIRNNKMFAYKIDSAGSFSYQYTVFCTNNYHKSVRYKNDEVINFETI